MAIKLVLELLEKDGTTTKKLYLKGGLRKIANEFPEIEYHQLRAIYLKCNNLENRKLHRSNQALLERMKIYDYNTLTDDVRRELFLYY